MTQGFQVAPQLLLPVLGCASACVLATSTSLCAKACCISKACSRQLNLPETTEARVQAELWVGTGRARVRTAHWAEGWDVGSQGPWNLFSPLSPSLSASRRHFQDGSRLLPRVPGPSWWLPKGHNVRTRCRWNGLALHLDLAASPRQLL